MKVKSILNNNAVLVRTDNGAEAVVTSRGIGFNAKVGDVIQHRNSQKLFVLRNDEISRHFKELIVEVPYDIFDVCQDAFEHVKECLGGELDKSFFITLTDHVTSSIKRIREGIQLRNLLVWDTKLLYPKEYELAEWVCAYIGERCRCSLEAEEAATIAMHIVNSESRQHQNVADTVIEIQAILKIIRYNMMAEFDIESLSYYRFMVHLKLLIERVKNNVNTKQRLSEDICAQLLKQYPKEYRCAKKISEYFEEKYRYKMSRDELMFLLLHIGRLMDSVEEQT